MNQAKEKGPSYFGDQFADNNFDAPVTPTTEETIRKQAHVVNGGEAQFRCPACKGTGRFTSYTGRTVGNCFKCKGKGNISKGQAAAAKGKATKLANQQAWAQEHRDEIAYINKRDEKGSNYYLGFQTRLAAHGSLYPETIETIRKDMVRDAEFYAAKRAERDAARPLVPTEALEALFNQAKVKLAKVAIFRTVDITISRAPATGMNAGALYVKDTDSGEYCGKIVGGKWVAKYGTKDVTEALQRVAADPTAEAIKYGNKFRSCCCCGNTLRNPVSVLAIVGPVCGPKWGLDHLRMAAAEMLANEANEEEDKQ
jgi:Family of unknown function (DUF6011)